MDLTYTVADPLVDALSAQFESRTPRATDDRGTPTETTAEHVQRAHTEWLDAETVAARKVAAKLAVDTAQDDTELAAALVAQRRLTHPAQV